MARACHKMCDCILHADWNFFLWLCTMVDFVNDPQRFVEGGVDVVDIVALICGLR